MRTFHILPPQTEGYAGFLAAMQLAKSAECLDEQRKSAQIPALQLLKSLDDLDEDADDEDEEDYDYDDEDEDEDEDEEDLDDEFGEEEDEDDDLDDEDEDEDDEDVKPLKM